MTVHLDLYNFQHMDSPSGTATEKMFLYETQFISLIRVLVLSNTIQIAVNGLLSFEQPYGSFFNQPFPGFFFISSRYLVAPFWDDADIRGGDGQISYEVHTSGYLIDHISAFIRARKPSPFQGTWMLVVFYDAVQPYFGTGVSKTIMSGIKSLVVRVGILGIG